MKSLILTTILALTTLGTFATGTHCTATTKAGEPCKAWAQTGAKYCYFHNPSNQCEAIKKDGTKCHAMKVGASKYCQHHQK